MLAHGTHNFCIARIAISTVSLPSDVCVSQEFIIFQICDMTFFKKHILLDLFKQVRLNSGFIRNRNDGPVKWLDDAVTYADVEASFVDPCTSLPYPEKVNFSVDY